MSELIQAYRRMSFELNIARRQLEQLTTELEELEASNPIPARVTGEPVFLNVADIVDEPCLFPADCGRPY